MAKVTREYKKLFKALKKHPQNVEVLLQLAWMYWDDHGYNEAKQYFTRVLDIGPAAQAAADAGYGLALIENHAGHAEQAQERLRSIFTVCPGYEKRAEVHLLLAQINERLWRTTDWPNARDREASDWLQGALDHYQQAIERRSEQQGLASLHLGKLLYDLERPAEAEPYFRQAANAQALKPQQVGDACYFLGLILQARPDQAAAARECFQRALKYGPPPERGAQIHAQLGTLARQLGDDATAVDHFEHALTLYGDAHSEDVRDVLLNLGELKLAHRWYQEAAEYGERAQALTTEAAPARPRVTRLLAEACYGTRDYAKAEEYEQECLRQSTDNRHKAESHLRLGLIYEHQELYQKAADAYRKGVKFADSNQMISRLNGDAGRMYLREGRLNQANKHLKEALSVADDEAPETAVLYRVMGDCHVQREEIEPALEMYGTVIAKFPDSTEEPAAREALKRFRKQFKKAMQERERALRADEAMPMAAADAELEELQRLSDLITEILDEKGFFQRLKEGLAKTHLSLVGKIEELLAKRSSVDDALIEDLEEVLILSDLGVATTQRIITSLQEKVKRKELQDPAQVKSHLQREVSEILQGSEKRLDLDREQPFVILVIGVNGTGKTTSIGKMASQFKAQGKTVMLAAGDTFRAAAIEQLDIWGERAGCDVVKHASGADPSAVMFDAIKAAKSRGVDVLIADTAGRLHTKKNLMEELKKMVRIVTRELPGAPHEILMVVDATTGQNAISQAQLFHEGVGLTGLILTKLDGTAKGGIVVSIANDLKIPVTYIGIGEKVEDLREFHAREFAEALFED